MSARGLKPDPFADAGARAQAGRLGMWVFLASLAMLFGASVIGFLVIRTRDLAWPEAMPALPRVLWISTLLLAASSVTIQAAVAAARDDAAGRLRRALAATLGLGVAFLGLQVVAWWTWRAAVAASAEAANAQAFAMTAFYVLTGVHALHVIGGLVPLGVVTERAWRGRYSAGDHAGVQHVALYWHFLDGVWLVLFLTLLVGV